jgi:CRISPR-associated endoribonuclease Cas6
MLTSFVAQLDLLAGSSIPATHGEAMQAEFLRRIGVIRPGLERRLHGNATPPYTTSPLMGPFAQRGGWLCLSSGGSYWFRLTGLTQEVSEALEDLAEACSSWEIRGARFGVRSWLRRPGQHAWAGSTSLGQLWQAAQLADVRQPDRVEISFLSPTSFSIKRDLPLHRAQVLPLPDLVFGNLTRRLSSLHPELGPLPSYHDLGGDAIVLGRYEIRTRIMSFRAHEQLRPGFVGSVEFLLDPTLTRESRLAFHFLAGFAFYSGVGVRTTWGMGQARREPLSAFAYRGNQVESYSLPSFQEEGAGSGSVLGSRSN